jgi:excisionase family DNA binding protein
VDYPKETLLKQHLNGAGKSAPPTTSKLPTRLSDLPDVLTVDQVADVLSICRNAAYEAVRTGQVRHVKIGRTIRVPKMAVEELLAGYDATQPMTSAEHRKRA